jgi:hypothetical protein
MPIIPYGESDVVQQIVQEHARESVSLRARIRVSLSMTQKRER